MRILPYGAMFLAVLAGGCGSGSGDGGGVAPPNSTIAIVPTEINYQPYFGTALPLVLGPDFITVTVNNASGNPIRGASVTIFHAGDNSIIKSDRAGNFLGFQTEPHVDTTDDFGNVYLYVLTPASDTLGDSSEPFEAFSGGAYNTINVNMTCVDANTSSPLTCN